MNNPGSKPSLGLSKGGYCPCKTGCQKGLHHRVKALNETYNIPL